MAEILYKSDCRHFKGYIPCPQHKRESVHCSDCTHYDKIDSVILIIKLGAIGDVIRTTPLIDKIRKEHPTSLIWWLTYSPDVVPSIVDTVMGFTPESLLLLEETKFKKVINLDKDTQACALTNRLNADKKFGFELVNGRPAPINTLSEHKFLTGLFDDVNQANTKSYPEEIFEICGWKFEGQEYVLDVDKSLKWDIPSEGKRIIGLNTGCGDRWRTRLWKDEYWLELIAKILEAGYFPILLGGPQEDEKNKRFAAETGAYYSGYYPLKKFFSLMDECDTIVTAVTMGLHIAVALKKKVVLMNNIFNPYEFEMYGRGTIVQPTKKCTCYFSPSCKNPDYFCLDSLTPEMIFKEI